MATNDIHDLLQAQRRLLRRMQGQIATQSELGPEDRERLIARYKAELAELHREKQKAVQRFDEEISHYEELIKGLETGSGKEQETQQPPRKKRPSGEQSPRRTPGG